MTINANEHPFKVLLVSDDTITANDHPYKVVIEGGGPGGFDTQVVDELPAEGQSGILYLVPNDEPGAEDYKEYLWVLKDGTYGWELIGSTGLTYSDFTGATEDNPGLHGLVPAPAYIENILCSDGQWRALFPDSNMSIQFFDGYIRFSSENTTYSAGTNIDMTNNVISTVPTMTAVEWDALWA